MPRIRVSEWLLLGLGLVVFCGCDPADTRPPTYPVMGTVKMKGKPVEGVAVSFVPEGTGESAVGVTDSAGNYKLTTRVKDDGAVTGKYQVTLAKYDGQKQGVSDPSEMHADYDVSDQYPPGYDESKAQSPMSKNLLPMRYALPTTSGFAAEVAEKDNSFDFEIK
jgi:hypothetical protein